jgi:hypothetical protein
MKKETWSWVMAGTLFAAIAGVWFWQLPNIIKHTAGEGDNGLSGIFSTLDETKDAVAGDLQKVQVKLDANMKSVGEAVPTQKAQAAVIDDMKERIENGNEAEDAPAPAVDPDGGLKTADQVPPKK